MATEPTECAIGTNWSSVRMERCRLMDDLALASTCQRRGIAAYATSLLGEIAPKRSALLQLLRQEIPVILPGLIARETHRPPRRNASAAQGSTVQPIAAATA